MAVSPSSKNNVTFIRMPCEEKSQPLIIILIENWQQKLLHAQKEF